MSYDVYLEVDTGGREPPTVAWIGTYPISVGVDRMWRRALPPDGVAMLDGKNAGKVASEIQRAVKRMENNPAEYGAMNPNNRWVDYQGALSYLRILADACEEHLKCTFQVSG